MKFAILDQSVQRLSSLFILLGTFLLIGTVPQTILAENKINTPLPNASSPLGTNLAGLCDWSTEIPFIDAFKTSRSWISGNSVTGAWDDKRPIQTDSDGWPIFLLPNQIAKTLMFWDISKFPVASYPAGRYTVFYKGDGKIEYGFGAKIADSDSAIPHSSPRPYPSSLHQDTIDVDSSKSGIMLTIAETNPKNPIRDIHVIPPGGRCSNDQDQYCLDNNEPGCGHCNLFTEHYTTQIFHPNFIRSIRPYSTLRFMDWMATNGSQQKTWTQRPKITDARWDHGAPVEIMVALANRLHADPWFNMPHQADNEYVREFAKYVQAHLNPDLKTYIEYSNEVWNGQSQQARYALEQGKKMGLSNNDFQAQLFYYSLRSREIFNIFSSVLPKNRLVRVMGSQAANPWVTEQVLYFDNAYLETDVLAIAPYFYMPDKWPTSQAKTILTDEAIKIIREKSFPQLLKLIKEQSETIRRIDPRIFLVAYEGGQSLVAGGWSDYDNPFLNALFDNVNRSPQMESLYLTYLKGWKDNGGKLFLHYNDCGTYSKWGRWGSMEYIGQDPSETPKYTALQEFIRENKVWW